MPASFCRGGAQISDIRSREYRNQQANSLVPILHWMFFMARKPFVCNPERPYHITARTNGRVPFRNLNATWEVMEDYLFSMSHFHKAQILSFVLMNNHFHLLARFPEANTSTAMCYFMTETSRQISRIERTENHSYGSRFFRSEIGTYHQYKNVYKYVYRNPVRAGICSHPAEYIFSTLPGLLGQQVMSIPVAEDLTLFSDLERTLAWLASSTNPDDEKVIKTALKHSAFKVSTDRRTGKPHRLETSLL